MALSGVAVLVIFVQHDAKLLRRGREIQPIKYSFIVIL